ncbi:non-reducing end alpha-L-arabinofuranosidase family hydrolase [Nonomuraea sp. NPDC049784]|uniref:non-reducing end alpha-L-arabinofuranosidase family hydrolase n=1 Tax=Nonomuraea sp. NPDC049784 TaxID=3154361 RepID=UPI003403A940
MRSSEVSSPRWGFCNGNGAVGAYGQFTVNASAAGTATLGIRFANGTFDSTAWTRDISHGEMIRNGIDQTLTINPCHIQYLYQGKDPAATDPYNLLPWRLGLLAQTNSTC